MGKLLATIAKEHHGDDRKLPDDKMESMMVRYARKSLVVVVALGRHGRQVGPLCAASARRGVAEGPPRPTWMRHAAFWSTLSRIGCCIMDFTC